MFILTAKMSRSSIIAAIVAAAVLLVAVVVILVSRGGTEAYNGDEAMNTAAADKNTTAATNEERVAYLESFGWKVQNEPREFLEVAIPEKFDKVYEKYNEIQKEQGFNLEKYRGKRVMKYTYDVLNHPSANGKSVYATLLVYKSKVIGGDVCSAELSGFMHGFAMPTADTAAVSGDQSENANGSNSTAQQNASSTAGATPTAGAAPTGSASASKTE